jgi:hypothetical protein
MDRESSGSAVSNGFTDGWFFSADSDLVPEEVDPGLVVSTVGLVVSAPGLVVCDSAGAVS